MIKYKLYAANEQGCGLPAGQWDKIPIRLPCVVFEVVAPTWGCVDWGGYSPRHPKTFNAVPVCCADWNRYNHVSAAWRSCAAACAGARGVR